MSYYHKVLEDILAEVDNLVAVVDNPLAAVEDNRVVEVDSLDRDTEDIRAFVVQGTR